MQFVYFGVGRTLAESDNNLMEFRQCSCCRVFDLAVGRIDMRGVSLQILFIGLFCCILSLY